MVINVVLTGIGGQGVVTMAGLLRWAVLGAGWRVTGADNRGGAQRLGHVAALIRITDEAGRLLGPDVPDRGCDLLVSLEASEGLRYSATLGPVSRVLYSPVIRIPTNERRRQAPYLDAGRCDRIYRRLAGRGVFACDFAATARVRCGDARLANLLALGAAVALLGLPPLGPLLAGHLEEPSRAAFLEGKALVS